MIRANLFAFAFDLSDITRRKPLEARSAKRPEQNRTSGKIDESDDDRLSGSFYSEGVFWGVHLPF